MKVPTAKDLMEVQRLLASQKEERQKLEVAHEKQRQRLDDRLALDMQCLRIEHRRQIVHLRKTQGYAIGPAAARILSGGKVGGGAP